MVALGLLGEEVQLHICTRYTCLTHLYLGWVSAAKTDLGLRCRGLVNSCLQSACLTPWESKEKHLIAKMTAKILFPSLGRAIAAGFVAAF